MISVTSIICEYISIFLKLSCFFLNYSRTLLGAVIIELLQGTHNLMPEMVIYVSESCCIDNLNILLFRFFISLNTGEK